MFRRSLLKYVGVSSASITSIAGSATAESSSSSRYISQVSEASIGIAGIETSSELVDSSVNNDSSAEIRIHVKNTTEESYSLEYKIPNQVNRINGERKTGSASAFVIGSTNQWEQLSKQGFSAARSQVANDGRKTVTGTMELEPGGTYTMQYELWSAPGSSYLPPGNYQFHRQLRDDNVESALKFELLVEK